MLNTRTWGEWLFAWALILALAALALWPLLELPPPATALYQVMESYAVRRIAEFQTLIAATVAVGGLAWTYRHARAEDREREETEARRLAAVLADDVARLAPAAASVAEAAGKAARTLNPTDSASAATVAVSALRLPDTMLAVLGSDELSRLGSRTYGGLTALRLALAEAEEAHGALTSGGPVDRRDIEALEAALKRVATGGGPAVALLSLRARHDDAWIAGMPRPIHS